MNKEEILRKSRNTFKGYDPFERLLSSLGYQLGSCVAVAFSVIVSIIQYCMRGESNYDVLAVGPLLYATEELFVGIWMKNKKRIVRGVLCLAFAIAVIVSHFVTVFGA